MPPFSRITGLLTLLCACACLSCQQKELPPRPNILLIMADDIGYSDIGSFGAEIETPHLDRLAEEGIRLTQFYNMAKCETTRSAMITGLYRGDARARSMGGLLRDAGYYTITSGKEHFSDWVPDSCYATYSFDRSLTFWATTEYFVPPDSTFSRPFFLQGRELHAREIKAEQQPMYKTDFITDYALRWLDTALLTDRPFFLYLPYHAAHYPLQARPADIAKYRGKYRRGWDEVRSERYRRMLELGVIPASAPLSPPSDNVNRFRGHPEGFAEERRAFPLYRPWSSLDAAEQDDLDLEMAVFAAIIDRMDQNIGRVLDHLDKAGQLDNTLILFLTDNGSCPYDSNRNFNIPPGPADSYRCLSAAWANVGNTPYRYFKQYGHEGGSHTHFIARWPGVIPAGALSPEPAHVVDLLPTLLEAGHGAYPESVNGRPSLPLHGRSLMPVLKGGEREDPAYIISGFSERFRMYREGPWKIVHLNGTGWELYNLAEDPTELHDLSDEDPERVEAMLGRYRDRQESFLYPDGTVSGNSLTTD